MTKTLILPISKQWFDLILSGVKVEEYREIKPYYNQRFIDKKTNRVKHYDLVILRIGYGKKVRSMTVKCGLVHQGNGVEEWGAEPNKIYWIIPILEIIATANLKK